MGNMYGNYWIEDDSSLKHFAKSVTALIDFDCVSESSDDQDDQVKSRFWDILDEGIHVSSDKYENLLLKYRPELGDLFYELWNHGIEPGIKPAFSGPESRGFFNELVYFYFLVHYEELTGYLKISLPRRAYKKYQMYWMLTHGITMDDIYARISEWKENKESDEFSGYLEEQGFDAGSLWVCFDEFLASEYEDKEFMKVLLSKTEFQEWLREHGFGEKIYAVQVEPECQESDIWDDCFWENVAVFGNRDYKIQKPEFFQKILDAVDDWGFADSLCLNDSPENYSTVVHEISESLPPCAGRTDSYSAEEIEKLRKLIPAWFFKETYDNEDLLCKILSIVTGKTWGYRCIRGSSQSDWNYFFYQADEWTDEAIQDFETRYFNEGTQWIVHDEDTIPCGPEDITGFSVYCTSIDMDGIKQEIAQAASGNPEDVVLYPCE